MFVKPVSPIPNVFTKILIASTIILVNILTMLSGSLIGSPINGYHNALASIIDPQYIVLIVYYVLLLLISVAIILLGIFNRKHGMLMGFTRSLLVIAGYTSILVILGILLDGLTTSNIESIVKAILWFIVVIVLLLITMKMPPTAFTIYRVVGEKLIPLASEKHVELEKDNKLVIRIYGDVEKLDISYEPENIFDQEYVIVKPSYVDLVLTPLYEGVATIYISSAKESIVYKTIRVSITSLERTRVKVKVFINDNLVLEQDVELEINKKIEHLINNLVGTALERYGIPRERVKSIRVTDNTGNIYLPSTRIRTIKPVGNELKITVVIEEEFKEILEKLGTADITKLWEILMKRLEILRTKLKDLYSRIEEVLRKPLWSPDYYGEIL